MCGAAAVKEKLDIKYRRFTEMYITKYWGSFIGGSDDSLNLVAF